MKPLQQYGINFERLPYYHPPRSRPVTLEKPSRSWSEQPVFTGARPSGPPSASLTPTASTHNNQPSTSHNQQLVGDFNQEMATYNRSPRPFERDHHQVASGQNQGYRDVPRHYIEVLNRNYLPTNGPKILVNDQSWPTSTVHKSLLNSRSLGQADNVSQVPLTQPDVVPTSYGYNDQNLGSSVSNQQQWLRQQRQQDGMIQHQLHQSDTRRGLPVETHSGNSYAPASVQYQSPPSALQNVANYENQRGFFEDRDKFFVQSLPRRTKSLRKLPNSSVLPDTKKEEYMWSKQLERASIAHQTYRTLPIVMPKPKARHDLAMGTYMQLSQDPTWDLARARPSSLRRDYDEKIQQAIYGRQPTLATVMGITVARPSVATM